MAAADVIAIGLLVGGDDRDDAESLAEDLPHALGERIGGDAKWRTELCVTEPADAAASSGELIAARPAPASDARLADGRGADETAVA